MPAGQYMWNFTFTIPNKTPSSFQYISATGDSFSVKYAITVYFNDVKPLMTQSKEIQIVSRAKAIRKTDDKKQRAVENAQVSRSRDQTYSGGKKVKDDATFQNLEDIISSPNKLGFDSIESDAHQVSRMDLKNNFDILHQTESMPLNGNMFSGKVHTMVPEESKYEHEVGILNYNSQHALINIS